VQIILRKNQNTGFLSTHCLPKSVILQSLVFKSLSRQRKNINSLTNTQHIIFPSGDKDYKEKGKRRKVKGKTRNEEVISSSQH
jgi:hypothetical protein